MLGREFEPISLEADAKSRRHDRGFTLIEIMVTIAIGTIGILGATALFSDMFKIQKRASTMQTIGQMRGALMSAVVNAGAGGAGTSAWELSIADASGATGNPLLACLRNNTPCLKDVTPAIRLNIKDAAGNELFYSRTATRGFNSNGLLCNTFSIVIPDPQCPFSWNIGVTARCVGTDKPSCVNPIVEIDGKLQYAPGGTTDSFNGVLNVDQFKFNVRRGDKTDKNEPIVVSYIDNDPLAPGETVVGNGCYQTWYSRKLNTISSDPAGNAALPSPVGTTFQLSIGSYECRIQAPAFKNGGNKIRLIGVGVNIESGISTAAMNGESATVILQANFNLNTPTFLEVQQNCSSMPALAAPENAGLFGSTNNDFMLGVPVPAAGSYTGTTYTTVSCIKTSG